METTAYLERINYTKTVNLDISTLYGLHLAHMLAVPFENLDIALGRTIRIAEQDIWDKIILKKRGGFCYELNGLFAWLLRQIGFDVTYINARVFNRTGNLGSDFDHLTLLVQIPGLSEQWLADVGFGDSFTKPLRFDERGEQTQGLRAYRIEQLSNGYVVWQKSYVGEWQRQYFFDLQPHNFPKEYLAGCHYHQTSPNSSFTRGSIISKATSNGRVTLEETKLIVTESGRKIEWDVVDKTEYQSLLKEYFNVIL